MDVFVSYSSPDRAVARRLATDLRHGGLKVWIDDDNLRFGDRIVDEVEQALAAAESVIVIVSLSSLQSSWVQREWQSALAQSRRVIPALVGGLTFNNLPPILRNRVGVNLERDYNVAVSDIIRSVRTLEESTEPPPAAVIDKDAIVADITAQVLERIKMERVHTTLNHDEFDESLIFVITSFRPDMEPAFEAIQAAAAAVGLRAERVKDIKGDYRITDQILSMIRRARIIVADLTYERPNVYFELGYARGLGKLVVTILRHGSEAHFDVRDWTYLEYFDSRPLEQDLRQRFEHELSRLEPRSQ